MATESPSWTEDEDQPWDDTEIEFDEEIPSPIAVSKTKGHHTKSELGEKTNQAENKENPIHEVGGNKRDTKKTSAETPSIGQFTEHSASVDLSAKEPDAIDTEVSLGNIDITESITGSHEVANPTVLALLEVDSVEQAIGSQNTAKLSNGTSDLTNDHILERKPPSFVDSNVLDSSEEEVEVKSGYREAIPEVTSQEPKAQIAQNGIASTENNGEEDIIWPSGNNTSSKVDIEPSVTAPVDTKTQAFEEPKKSKDVSEGLSERNDEAFEADTELVPPESKEKVEGEEATEGKEEEEEVEVEEKRGPRNYQKEYAGHSQHQLISRIETLETQLENTEEERDKVKDQLEGFLSKISSMKAVFQNYKVTQEELEVVKSGLAQAYEDLSASESRTEELESEVQTLTDRCAELEAEITKAATENERLAKNFASLNTESSDLNNECDRLSLQLTTMQREYQLREDNLQDEKYNLENEVSKLTKKVSEQKAAFNELEVAKEELTMTKKNLELVIEELKGSIEEKDQALVDAAAKVSVENQLSQSRLDEMEAQIKAAEQRTSQLQQEMERLQDQNDTLMKQNETLMADVERYKTENERIAVLEEEVQSKQVMIGKLRHEAIILNEHLTKSLSMLRKQLDDGEGSVDKELISNLFINFLQLPRGDTKKFEALQLISSFLNWDDLRQIQAGLTNRGASERGDEPKPGRLSFISLWTDFLDKESTKK